MSADTPGAPALPAQFDLEHQPPSVLDLFAAIITTAADDPAAWSQVNRELPVRLFAHEGAVVIHWWERTPNARPERSAQRTAHLPDWLWAMLDEPTTTPDSIRQAGRAAGVLYPPRVRGAK